MKLKFISELAISCLMVYYDIWIWSLLS